MTPIVTVRPIPWSARTKFVNVPTEVNRPRDLSVKKALNSCVFQVNDLFGAILKLDYYLLDYQTQDTIFNTYLHFSTWTTSKVQRCLPETHQVSSLHWWRIGRKDENLSMRQTLHFER